MGPTDDLADAMAADWNLPNVLRYELRDRLEDVVWSEVDAAYREMTALHLWPQQCPCGPVKGTECDYHGDCSCGHRAGYDSTCDIHGIVRGGDDPIGRYTAWWTDDEGREWPAGSWKFREGTLSA